MTEQGCRVASVLMAATALASAQTGATAETTTMAPLVVTASRLERTSMEMAANASIITAEQIQGSGVSDTAQAIEMLGGVYMRHLNGNGTFCKTKCPLCPMCPFEPVAFSHR